ncbi:hypothetical protein EXIGLDRAFT_776617 [Exidia glandulosa HHB12029]|uniref:Uncharacterized protein n=1 Tax=Exidia glandulosa HHB12029 TaxID=1314781 RepID=A0A165DEK2_EXIGL|nr:hypothetical protein EXIGLDRAFT_776617 [Exidia glandulosa HHB12029]
MESTQRTRPPPSSPPPEFFRVFVASYDIGTTHRQWSLFVETTPSASMGWRLYAQYNRGWDVVAEPNQSSPSEEVDPDRLVLYSHMTHTSEEQWQKLFQEIHCEEKWKVWLEGKKDRPNWDARKFVVRLMRQLQPNAGHGLDSIAARLEESESVLPP